MVSQPSVTRTSQGLQVARRANAAREAAAAVAHVRAAMEREQRANEALARLSRYCFGAKVQMTCGPHQARRGVIMGFEPSIKGGRNAGWRVYLPAIDECIVTVPAHMRLMKKHAQVDVPPELLTAAERAAALDAELLYEGEEGNVDA